ncbi:imidazole glycerol phosphate synthase subunit HisH [Azospirillum sp.]|uniref:imidazole glycerol phosphate synthase subunit HisH n=1 Tax=Azospirillum sp. TaxID=34012 RepID=UPI002619746A|nr:imidazole glycerol phosphate synthase subunit HisH [Azospirillum sp.]
MNASMDAPANIDVVIVDYGLGNLLSVQRAVEEMGGTPLVTSDPEQVRMASRLILPGVGAFGDGMTGLRERGLVSPLQAAAARGVPFLGICLGMQLMMGVGQEFGSHEGLDLIPGRVVAVPATGTDGHPHRVPHIGWNTLLPGSAQWEGSVLKDTQPGQSVYFVHSYMAELSEAAHCVAVTDYDGVRIPAVIRHGSLSGCQFHPERSGPVGLRILKNFLTS